MKKKGGWIMTASIAVIGGFIFLYLTKTARMEVSLSPEDIQNELNKKFPVEQKFPLGSITYSNPFIHLEENSNRVGLQLDSKVSLAGKDVLQGSASGDWQIEYDSETKTVYFNEIDIKEFKVKGLPDTASFLLTNAAQPLLRDYLKRIAVYKLRDGEATQLFARTVLKSAEVKNGRLVLTFGAP